MTHAELLAAGFQVPESAHEALTRFLDQLLERNQRVNLTAVRDVEQAWRVHFCDSLALLRVLPERPAQSEPRVTLLDIGSGGGLPGVPVAIVRPDVRVTLLDATRKKADAIGGIVAALGLDNVAVVCGRAETKAHEAELREQFDIVTARAVAPLRTLLELAAGFVRVAGQAWLFKTLAAVDMEVAEARAAAAVCGLVYAEGCRYRVPGDAADRVLVGYRKREALPADLPRGAGVPGKRPL